MNVRFNTFDYLIKINKMLNNLFIKLDQISDKKLFFILYKFKLIYGLTFLFIWLLLDDSPPNTLKSSNINFSNPSLSFFKIVIIGPIIETYFFQHIIIKFLYRKIGILALVFSTTIFGILHLRIYLLFLFSGFIYSVYYYYLCIHKQKKAFWSVCLLHIFYNFTMFSLAVLVYKLNLDSNI